MTGFLSFLKRFLGNRTSRTFVANPFEKGEIISEDGHVRRTNRRVGFLELFYDLFLVAALNVFTRESNFGSGTQIGSYVVFFTILWSVWVSQAFYDVRYGSKDRMSWFFGFLNLLVYGYIAASSGNFDVSYGLYPEAEENLDVPQYVERVGGEAVEDPSAIRRSLLAASAVYAISRILLLIQYIKTLVQAKRAGHPLRAMLVTMTGLVVSAALWFGAMGADFSTSRPHAIARLCLWIAGLVIEFSCLIISSTSSKALYYELEYWTERFAALTLIVIGEGVIGLFEQFRSVVAGVTTEFRSVTIGQLFAAVGLYRVLYALYFQNHTHELKGGTLTHIFWGLIHFPLHLSLLLFTQCIVHAIAASNVLIGVQEYVFIVERIETALNALENPTIAEIQETFDTSTIGQTLSRFATQLGVNFEQNLQTYAAEANGDVSTFRRLYVGNLFSILARIFSNYGYEPTEEAYYIIDEALNQPQEPDYDAIFAEDTSLLLQPVYTSAAYGFTVLGGVLVSVAALALLQEHKSKTTWKVITGYKFFLGVLLLLLSLLDIGHNVTIANILGQGSRPARIDRLVTQATYLPALFLLLFSITIVQVGCFLFDAYQEDKKGVRDPALDKKDNLQIAPKGSPKP